MVTSKKDTVSPDDQQAVLGTIQGIPVPANFVRDRETNHFLFVVHQTPEGWGALPLLRVLTQQDATDGSKRVAGLSPADPDTCDPNFRLYWGREGGPVCGPTPGEVMEALEARGYGPVETADEEVEGS